MSALFRLRQYHAALAVLVVLAFVSGEWGLVHAWLGYLVGLVILVRLIWATAGVRQLGLSRFYPVFQGLRLHSALTHPAISRTILLGIAISLVGSTGTGLMMDRGRAIGLADMGVIGQARADDDRRYARGKRENDSILGEIHEALANLLMTLVALHVGYLLIFKFPLVRFMLFVDTPEPGGGDARP